MPHVSVNTNRRQVVCWQCENVLPCCVLQDGDKQETDRNYENMWRKLRSDVGIGQRVPLIRLVLNHASFAQTVENIFTLSFLVSKLQLVVCCTA